MAGPHLDDARSGRLSNTPSVCASSLVIGSASILRFLASRNDATKRRISQQTRYWRRSLGDLLDRGCVVPTRDGRLGITMFGLEVLRIYDGGLPDAPSDR